MFPSSSSVKNVLSRSLFVEETPIPSIVIGEHTKKTVLEYGERPVFQSQEDSIESLLESILQVVTDSSKDIL